MRGRSSFILEQLFEKEDDKQPNEPANDQIGTDGKPGRSVFGSDPERDFRAHPFDGTYDARKVHGESEKYRKASGSTRRKILPGFDRFTGWFWGSEPNGHGAFGSQGQRFGVLVLLNHVAGGVAYELGNADASGLAHASELVQDLVVFHVGCSGSAFGDDGDSLGWLGHVGFRCFSYLGNTGYDASQPRSDAVGTKKADPQRGPAYANVLI